MRSNKPQRQLNALGETYKQASKAAQLKFLSALYELADMDGSDYYRAFRDNWQYTEHIGRAPFVIVQAAIDHLGYKPLQPNTTVAMLQTLKMQAA